MPAVYLLFRYRNHWAKLHQNTMTESELNHWIDTIPGYEDLSCDCQKEIYKLLETNPPRFDDWQRWSWEIHNAVNLKINKPILTYSDACKLWAWDLTHPNPPA
jgi:hypothetical protein